jgi:hypothetical protein
MAAQHTVIPFPDYQRIFDVTFSVLDERAHTAHACVFFALIGAMILNEKYRIAATATAGAAAYLVDARSDPKNVSLFGRFENEELVSADDAFHCWIEANGVVVDFMAPLFEESLRSVGSKISVPRRMFQRPKSQMARSFSEMRDEGDFLLQPNGMLSKQLFQAFAARPGSVDLLHVCLTWYTRPPKPLPRMAMHDDIGEVYPLNLKGPAIDGIW